MRRRAALSGPAAQRESRQRGFTLLEISLVLLIFAVVLSFAMPRLRDPGRMELRSHVRRLATKIRFLRSEAILTGRTYRMNYDLDSQRYWASTDDVSGDTVDDFSQTGPLARPVTLPDTVAFSDIVLEGAGRLDQGEVYTRFFPDGTVDTTVVHMDNGLEAYTVVVWPFTGKVSRFEGYRTLAQVGG